MALWPIRHIAGGVEIFAALSTWEFLARRYGPVILLTVLLVAFLIMAHRLWQEMHERDELTTPGELLESLERAHADGELDDEEIERVRLQLKSLPNEIGKGSSTPPSSAAPPRVRPKSTLDRVGTESDQAFDDLLP